MLRTTLRYAAACLGLTLLTASDCDTTNTFGTELFPGPPPVGTDTHISGRVLHEDGDNYFPDNPPVANAVVVLAVESQAFGSVKEVARTNSDANGGFDFDFGCHYRSTYRVWIETDGTPGASNGGINCGSNVYLIVP